MELQRIEQNGKISYMLLDSSMNLIRSANRYLDYLRIRGRAEAFCMRIAEEHSVKIL